MSIKKAGIFSVSLLAVGLVGCNASSVISAINNWLPFGLSVAEGVVSVVAPGNTRIAADGNAIEKAFATLQADVAAAAAVPGSGVSKVVGDIEAVLPSVSAFESDVQALGVGISAADQSYISASVAVLDAALEGFEAELNAQSPASVAPVALVPVYIESPDGTFTRYADGSYYASFKVDPTDPVNYASGGQAAAANPQAGKKAPKLGAFKRQYNAIAKKYGHADKQLKLSRLEKLHLE